MQPDAKFKVSAPDVVREVFDNEVVVVHLKSGNYFSLVGTATEIWGLIEAGYSQREMATHLTTKYEAGSISIKACLESFLQKLLEENLIVAAEDAGERKPITEADAAATLPFVPPDLAKYTDMQELLLLDPIHDVDEAGWPARMPPS